MGLLNTTRRVRDGEAIIGNGEIRKGFHSSDVSTETVGSGDFFFFLIDRTVGKGWEGERRDISFSLPCMLPFRSICPFSGRQSDGASP